ncbi:MAG: hypothetical protein WC238_03825 [Parcubacteria group bacterium]|jgi:hypothetical protein
MKRMIFVVMVAMVFFVGVAKAEENPHFYMSGEIGVAAPYVDEYTGEKISDGAVLKISATGNIPGGSYVNVSGFTTKDSVDKLSVFGGKIIEIKNGLFESLDLGVGASYYLHDRTYLIVYGEAGFAKIGKFAPFVYLELDNPGNDLIWKAGFRSDELISETKLTLEVGGSDAKPLTFARGTVAKKKPMEALGMKFVPWASIQKGFGDVAGNGWRAVVGLSVPFGVTEE